MQLYFEKRFTGLLLSLSHKLFFSFFFLSLTFGLMGCNKGILVFTLLKPIQSSLDTFSFCEKIMDCLTGKRKSWRIVLLLQFLLRSPRTVAGNTIELCVPFRPRTSIKGNTLCLRKSFSPQPKWDLFMQGWGRGRGGQRVLLKKRCGI